MWAETIIQIILLRLAVAVRVWYAALSSKTNRAFEMERAKSGAPINLNGIPRKHGHIARDLGRLTVCAAGAATGIGLALWALDLPSSPFFLASLGGSTIFLFGLTRAPAAQPRALFGGHLGGALIGVLCFQCFGDALWVYALSVTLTLIYMLITKTVHPPAGANPLIMVHGHANFIALWQPVGLGILILASVAVIWSRLAPGMVHYPTKWLDKSPPFMSWGSWNE